MRITAATDPGTTKPNEDAFIASEHVLIVVDGATARTETRCREGVSVYAHRLASALAHHAADRSKPMQDALAAAIGDVTAMHDPACDLAFDGTPCAVLAAARPNGDLLEWIVLGDVSLAIAHDKGLDVHRVTHRHVGERYRDEADRYPIGDPRKAEVLLQMKQEEHTWRNRPGGYWVASTDPAVAYQALTGAVALADVTAVGIFSDGAARLADLFSEHDFDGLLATAAASGPVAIIDRVRALEHADPVGDRYPRNKFSDDATVVYAALTATGVA